MSAVSKHDQTARAIFTEVEALHFEDAKKRAKELYKMGINLIKDGVQGRPMPKDTFASVIVELNNIAPQERLQHNNSFHSTFSKAYRVFVELMWYQCWEDGKEKSDRPVREDTRDEIIKNAQLAPVVLDVVKDIQTKFEYKCAREAAKHLTPSNSLWKKYLDITIEGVSSAKDLNIAGIWNVLKTLTQAAVHDWSSAWYPTIFRLNWEAVCVKTLKDFEEKIKPDVQKCLKEGDEYSLCLTMIYMGILKDPEAHPELREAVFSGKKGEWLGLVELMSLESPELLKELFGDNPVKDIIGGQRDRFWKTRYLATYFLKKLANGSYSEPSLKDFAAKSAEALKLRTESLKARPRPSNLLDRLKEISEQKAHTKKQIKGLGVMLKGKVRGDLEEKLKKAEEELEACEDLERVIGEEQFLQDPLKKEAESPNNNNSNKN